MKLFLKLFLIVFLISFSTYGQFNQIGLTTSVTSNCAEGTISIEIAGGNEPYRYNLYSTHYRIEETSSSTSHVFNNVPTGRYYVVVYDVNNVFGETFEIIPATFQASFDRNTATCNNNGSIITEPSGGAEPYTFLWSNGATTQNLENAASGHYFLTITDNNGCKYNSDSLFVGSDNGFLPTVTSSTYSCQAKANATVLVDGVGAPFTYYWKTSPVQTTQTATGLMPGGYEVVVTNANGCSATAYANIQATNSFNVEITSTPATCIQANGELSAVASGGTSPYSFLWDNGNTTSTLTGLTGYSYHNLTVTDATGCVSIKGNYVEKTTPIQIAFTNTSVTCGLEDGVANATASNGLAPYSYRWSTGATTSTISGLSPQSYSVYATDANGCQAYAYTHLFENNCSSTITGNIYLDFNNNCTQDTGEKGRSNMIQYSTNRYTYADRDGHYSIGVAPGNYTLTLIPDQYWTTDCSPNTISVNVAAPGNVYDNNNFYITPLNEVHDVSVYTYGQNQRGGFTRDVYIYYYNKGTQLESGAVDYTFSNDWDYVSAIPQPDYYNPTTRTATWNYSNLNPYDQELITISMSVPTSVGLNVLLSTEVKISTINTDQYEQDNTASWQTFTTNSYDPNDIQVSPQGTTAEGYITSEQEELTYLIRFQNTGNDVAYNVTVKNPIDLNLKEYTITMIGASHDYKASIKDGFITFDFEDINLPDSNHNEKESHGYVLYRVNRKSDLAPLTKILNSADIYFDYNVPVETNEVKNTIASTTPNASELQGQDDLLFYPNPCRDHAQLSINIKAASEVSVQLYSASGQQIPVLDNVSVGQGLQVIDLNLASFNLTTGLYVAKIVANDKVYTKSILINK
jgi:hypothetical protein